VLRDFFGGGFCGSAPAWGRRDSMSGVDRLATKGIPVLAAIIVEVPDAARDWPGELLGYVESMFEPHSRRRIGDVIEVVLDERGEPRLATKEHGPAC
jgi:hypothetical protein